jgi:hypothetical protein
MQAIDFKPFLSFSDLLSVFPFFRSVSSVDLFFLCFTFFSISGGRRQGGMTEKGASLLGKGTTVPGLAATCPWPLLLRRPKGKKMLVVGFFQVVR